MQCVIQSRLYNKRYEIGRYGADAIKAVEIVEHFFCHVLAIFRDYLIVE